ncbi:hypothetical protein EVAR_88303_1 [Eumeta japonica]|uniref:Secreted protein n=1 Tax=Eumeta variegata TaxID=151549 RepID=A0A4C1VN25_EUMVA|nr:hypothetical protein EVAR_88303_1 [Eumeta japonica]
MLMNSGATATVRSLTFLPVLFHQSLCVHNCKSRNLWPSRSATRTGRGGRGVRETHSSNVRRDVRATCFCAFPIPDLRHAAEPAIRSVAPDRLLNKGNKTSSRPSEFRSERRPTRASPASFRRITPDADGGPGRATVIF